MTPLEAAAGQAILVGDPRRAFSLAQELTVQPRMSHQARGLWGYVGTTDSGTHLTVQSTGSGGPSAVPVIGDLAAQGVGRMIRLGTCLATDPTIEAGTVILVERALVVDGAGSALSEGADFVEPDQGLLDALDGLGRPATVSSHDLVARHEPAGDDRLVADLAVARDLQTAATLAMCRRLEVPAAAILVVAEDAAGERLGEETLWDLFRSAGKAVLSRIERVGSPETTPSEPH